LLLNFRRRITQSNVVHYKRIMTKIFVRQEFFFDLEIFLTRPQSFFHFNLMNVFASLFIQLIRLSDTQYFNQLNYRTVS